MKLACVKLPASGRVGKALDWSCSSSPFHLGLLITDF